MKLKDFSQNRNLPFIVGISFMAQLPLTTLRFVVPIYAEHFGAGIFIIGVLGTAYGLTYSASALFFGRISDFVGHKLLAIIGLASYAAIAILYGTFDSPYQFIVGKALEGISMAMVWPSLEAIYSKRGSGTKEGALLMYTVSWSVASSAAPYFSSYLVKFGFIYPLLFSAIASIVGIYFLSRIRTGPTSEVVSTNQGISSAFDIVLPMALYGVNSSIFYSFYPVYGLFSGYGLMGTGILGSVYGIFLTVAFFIAFTLSKKVKIGILITIGAVFEVPVLLMVVTNAFFMNLIVVALLGGGLGLVYYSVMLNIFREFREKLGSKTGIFEASIGAGYVLGPFIGGIPTVLGYKMPWLISGIFSLFVVITLLLRLMTKRGWAIGKEPEIDT